MADIILETRGLKKYFQTNSGMLHAVDGIDLKIERGKTLGVVGEQAVASRHLGEPSCVCMNRQRGRLFSMAEILQRLGERN